MTTYDFTYKGKRGSTGRWVLRKRTKDAGDQDMVEYAGLNRAKSLQAAISYMKDKATKSSPISLMIHTIQGVFHEERTYPKSADPRASNG